MKKIVVQVVTVITVSLTLIACGSKSGTLEATSATTPTTTTEPIADPQPTTPVLVSPPTVIAPVAVTPPTQTTTPLVSTPGDPTLNPILVTGGNSIIQVAPEQIIEIANQVADESPVSISVPQQLVTVPETVSNSNETVPAVITAPTIDLTPTVEMEVPVAAAPVTTNPVVIAPVVSTPSVSVDPAPTVSPAPVTTPVVDSGTVATTINTDDDNDSIDDKNDTHDTVSISGSCKGKKKIALIWFHSFKSHKKGSIVGVCLKDKFVFKITHKKRQIKFLVFQTALY